MYWFLIQVCKIFFVKIWKWDFRNLNHRKSLNFACLHLKCVIISICLNTAEYTKGLMTYQTFMYRPSISHPLLCCPDWQCAVAVDCVGLGNWHPVISGSIVLTQGYIFVWFFFYVCSFCDVGMKTLICGLHHVQILFQRIWESKDVILLSQLFE